MATNLAWHNLVHNKVKTGVAVAGVVFAIVLMFMQLGFLEAVKAGATLIYEELDFDVCIRSKDYLNLADPRAFPRQRLRQAAAVSGVARATPLLVACNAWRNPKNGKRLIAICLGLPVGGHVLRDQALQQSVNEQLGRRDALFVDNQTRSEFGPQDDRRFGEQDRGVRVEINDTAFTIVDDYDCGIGLAASGAVMMNQEALQAITPGFTESEISLGLIRLEDGVDPEVAVSRLREALPDDVDILSRAELLTGEVRYWVYDTNYGLIFQLGVALSLIVGTAIVYQVLVSDVASLLPEYATLKAMGYANSYLAKVILLQSLSLALLGFAIGWLLSLGLYALTAYGAQIPVRMTLANMAIVLLLSIVMCTGSGLGAVRKAFQAEPADLF